MIYIEKLEANMYSILLFFGIIVAIAVYILEYVIKEYKHKGYQRAYIESVLMILPSVFIFSFGAYILDNFFHYLNGEEFGSSGISFLGGVIPLFLVYLIVLIKKPDNKFINCSVLLIPLIHSFGRIGCLFGGCCYGKPNTFGVIYWEGSKAAIMYGYNTPLFPTQILESIVCLILFLVLLLVLKKNRFLWYSIIYGVYRFFAEFLRGDNRGSTNTFLSPSQLMSIILILYGIIYLIIIKRRKTVD